MTRKRQRIRDPLHNLIEFNCFDCEFENMLWELIQLPSFQRLRRIKQLGFSEYVYPGATHTRFTHSLGVFHIARKMLEQIEKKHRNYYNNSHAQITMAAALLHDIGHGPFSHAFEAFGKESGLKFSKHEKISEEIIRNYDIGIVLNKFNRGLSDQVADVISLPPEKYYHAVVSSQFDADRLDYMQRDRLMTGTQVGGVDSTWLLANIEIAELAWGNEDQELGKVQTYVLGPKAVSAAESYVLGLFQLYPTVYFHKATRCLEKLYTYLLLLLHDDVQNGNIDNTNLPDNHPLIQFFKNPEILDNYLLLDDTVILGSLAQLENAKNEAIAELAKRIRNRNLLKCVDVLEHSSLKSKTFEDKKIATTKLEHEIKEWNSQNSPNRLPRLIVDAGYREPYKKVAEEGSLLNQISIRDNSGISDIGKSSEIISKLNQFDFFRIYVKKEDSQALKFVDEALAQ